MVRTCQCGKYLGSKCEKCGCGDLLVAEIPSGILFICINCNFEFYPSQGGITTGLCEECEAKLKEEIRA